MELKQSTISPSPRDRGRVRLSAEVTYDDGGIAPELYWFEVSEDCGASLSASGNPWLACLLPLAVTLGEPLRIHLPVDRALLENVQELMRIWKCWYPHLHVVPIEAELHSTQERQPPSKTAAFFSGGVDSFFTVLSHYSTSTPVKPIQIDDLIYVWGISIPLDNAEAFFRIRDRLQRAASDLGKHFIDVATNLRRTRLGQVDYGTLSNGCILASVGLAMEHRYKDVLIPSSHGYRDLLPWGSHPLTDPLLSTSRTKIIHDGAAFDRVEKTELLSQSDVATRNLHVCWILRSDENCGACTKCYRTMTTLWLLGALERCTMFPQGSFDERKVAKIYSADENDRSFLREIRRFAVRKGRLGVARAIDRSFRHSARYDKMQPIIRWLERKRLGWILDVARTPYRIWLDAAWRVDRRYGDRTAGRA